MPTPIDHTSAQPEAVLSVSQLNRLARQLLEDCFANVWVEGEISNFSRPSSGHWYFTLKDGSAQIRCAMFRNRNIRLRFQPTDGTKVLVKGAISLYEARGEYQLIAEDMQPAGAGLLAAQFELLKQKLQAEGLFAPARKKPLPDNVAHLAVITSATGAAVRDILTVLQRRSPNTRITIIPVPVQGEQAPNAIVRAIESANRLHEQQRHHFDAILLGRGGGSLEDLWAFNDENVARAIAASNLPIVSAVGHEVDFTIADFVADVRAATPSAAAELLSRDWREQLQQVLGWEQRLLQAWQRLINKKRQQLEWQLRSLQHPGQKLRQWALRLDELESRLINATKRTQREQQQHLQILLSRLQRHHPGQQLQQLRARVDFCRRHLATGMQYTLQQHRQQLQSSMQLLNSVSPLATLQRGYSITTDIQNAVLRKSEHVTIGDHVRTRLARGELISTITTIITEND